jgi:glucose-1-phosphate cytidylyltransferase
MKIVILAGGFGTRLSEYTKTIPKPMVKVGGKPIIFQIMKLYAKYGFNDFYIALGYKGEIIKSFFKKKFYNWNVTLVDTGKKTMTGGRLKKMKNLFRKNETFMMTYGDGISNVNLKKLVNFHKKNNSIATLTAVRPPARFGAIKIKGNQVQHFREKSKLDEGWINGGFFVFEPEIFNYIKGDHIFLEREPMAKLASKKKLIAYKHKDFWQCIDTKRDKDILEKRYK